MKISKIEPQKKNKQRCSIFIDGEFRVGLTKEIIVRFNLHEGIEITDREFDEILHQAEKGKIANRAFRLLHFRERSVEELRARLIRIGFDNQLVEELVDELIADKTLDDDRFANAFVNDYTNLKPRGNRFIINELNKKGIAKEIIAKLVSTRDERKMIRQYVKKKASSLDINNPKERQRLVRRLLTRGFTPDIVYEIIREW